MQVGAFSFLALTVKYTACNENYIVFITSEQYNNDRDIGRASAWAGVGMGTERGKNAHTQMRQGWLLGDWIEVLNDAGDELQLHPLLHLLVDTAV